ncbi:ribonuclease H-like domain-containing protein [Tanacetum coccineum]|uniref:Ribonuclease H-like domain-containing protein n=1 Tax=Tanacetum coccineum TaxID=301880 RepID=A0ABQ4Z0L8_9ASTR
METKDTLSSCLDLDEQEIQQLQKQANILKENSLNKLNALKTTIQHLSSSNSLMYYTFRDAFHQLFEAHERTFRSVLSRNIQNLERQLNKELLHEKDSNSDLCVIKVQFDKFIHSKVLEPSNYNSYDLETRQDFKEYTHMEAQTFKETIIQNMNSIEQCIIQEYKVQEVQASDSSLGDKDCSRIVSDKGNDQGSENQSNTYGDESSRSRNECKDKRTSGDDMDIRPSYDTKPMVEVPYTAEYNVFDVDIQHSEQPECIINTYVVEKADSNVTPDSLDMCDNEIQTDHNAIECDDERVALANLIANLKLDVDENKKIQNQLKKANASLTQELKECKSTLVETSRTLGESNSIRDSYLVAHQKKQTVFESYKAFNDRTVDYDKLERKLNETLGLLAQKEIDIKEGLKVKAYEISVVKEKHDKLVKQSLLTKSHYEGLVKEKTKVITDLKLKEEKDIDKMISIENQLKFLNEIVYKRIQSIETIHMLAPKCPTFNGRPTFANPMYLKKAQYEKPRLYGDPT